MSEPIADQRVEPSPDVLTQRLPDGDLVLLDLATERYFGLDSTGTAMWETLEATCDVGQAHARLAERFDVDPEVLRRDLDTFVGRLAAKGLLRRGDHPA